MRPNSSIEIEFQTITDFPNFTSHGLLVAAWQYAQACGAFDHWEQVKYRIKKVDYSALDKLKTFWLSIVAGCEHTDEINDKLGGHEQCLARL